MPKWVAVCLAVSVLASLCLVAAQMSYTLVKPFTLTITTASCPLSVNTVSFAYDPTLNQYPSCTMQIANSASQVTATVYVYLKNSTQGTIAQGQITQMFNSGASTVTVTLSWVSGASVAEVAGGYVVIQPS